MMPGQVEVLLGVGVGMTRRSWQLVSFHGGEPTGQCDENS